MMEQKIEAASALPTLREAGDQLHAIGGDLEDLSALVFELSQESTDYRLNLRSLRAVVLAIDSIAKRAIELGDGAHAAHGATLSR